MTKIRFTLLLLTAIVAGIGQASAQSVANTAAVGSQSGANRHQPSAPARVLSADQRYARNSVLADGRWVKIRVPSTGLYELTDELLQQAGFSDPARVKVYGYGGARQPEKLTASYVAEHDDLPELPTTVVNGRRLFYGVGPVNWASAIADVRDRNNYADYGCYFLTDEGDAAPELYDSLRFAETYYPLPGDYHRLYEVDDYSWYNGGRNLYDATWSATAANVYELEANGTDGTLYVELTVTDVTDIEVSVNDSVVGIIKNTGRAKAEKTVHQYDVAIICTATYSVSNLTPTTRVALRQLSGRDVHLDYISLRSAEPFPLTDLATGTFPQPELVGQVPNQNLHADPQADMVIIVPTSLSLLAEAERLKQMHEQQDGMRVNIVVAGDLYNEFSSGTPDANAYRRYMKMLYDRAESEEDEPHYLLLMGDCAWDNRMVLGQWRNYSPDDFLLSYESDNSLSETECYTSDDYFCMLDDNKGGDMINNLTDAAVGRMPARTADEARAMVDKTIRYRQNTDAGDWQNTICFMADDGNANLHMQDAEAVIDSVGIGSMPFRLNKIYWDAYPVEASAAGNAIPGARRLVKDQMHNGALIMNYTGHGNARELSHDSVVLLSDFEEESTNGLPLWIVAACDIIPFNTQQENHGETALANPKGGALGFISASHTVYAQLNRILNRHLMGYLIGATKDDPTVYSIGEALRLAKIAYYYEKRRSGGLETNKPNHRQYTLLGDPAVRLHVPTLPITIDRINGIDVAEGEQRLAAGQLVTVEGHVEGMSDFNGIASLTVCDVEELVTGRNNNQETSKDNWKPYSWLQRPTVLYNGSDNIRDGQFRFIFPVPKDITYSDEHGMMYVYAVNADRTLTAHGDFSGFSMGSGSDPLTGSEGPEIYCYLDNALFEDGGLVGESPYFYAEVYDPDGINVSGSGIGHDMELIIDGKYSTTYNLNTYFEYVFGDYRRGTVGYQIPALSPGEHVLIFRVWDVLNNSSFAQLSFVVGDGSGLQPDASGITQVSASPVESRSEVYNIKGQSIVRRQGRGLYIVRTPDGQVKKMVMGGQ